MRSFGLALSVAAVLACAVPAAEAGAWQPENTPRRAACPPGVAEASSASSGFVDRARSYWSYDFRVGGAICGRLSPDRVEDLVVWLEVVGGTGGSPHPWAILNGTQTGGYELAHEDVGQQLICETSIRLRRQTLVINRPSEYLGAFTLCDRLSVTRWKGGDYRVGKSQRAYRRCDSQISEIRRLRVANGVSCRRGERVARDDAIESTSKAGTAARRADWTCHQLTDSDGYYKETRCGAGHWNKWLIYVLQL